MSALSRWANILKRFARVTLQFSLDGIGKVIEYIRCGTHWDNVRRNLEVFLTEHSGARFVLAPCVQAYNLLSLHEIYSFCEQLKSAHPDCEIVIFPTILRTPSFLAINVLPRDLRERAVHRLLPVLDNDRFSELERRHLRSIIKMASSDEVSDSKARLKWRNHTLALDRHRGQSIKTSIPELGHLV